jgi:hypothetical protein
MRKGIHTRGARSFDRFNLQTVRVAHSRRGCGETLPLPLLAVLLHDADRQRGRRRDWLAITRAGTEKQKTKKETEVEPKGIEPSTFCMPCRRSPK